MPVFAALDDFYQHHSADLAIISAPIHLHAPLTCLALSMGSHALCEKPLAATLAEADQMMSAEKQYGKIVAIGYQWSFSEAVLALKQDILAGRLGRPLRLKTVVLWPRWRSYFDRSPWAGRIRLENGAWVLDSPLHNATAHYLHNMLFLLGDALHTSTQPTSLEVELYRANRIENFDTAALRVSTSCGAELLFITAHPVNLYRGPLIHYEFEHGIVEYPSETGTFRAHLNNGQAVDYGSPDTSNANKIWHTIDAIHTGTPVVCGLQAALPELVCVTAAQQAKITGFPSEDILVEETDSDRLVHVEGLEGILLDCYETWRMPSEIPAAGWANPAEKIFLE